jgi:hypothetical protein
MTEPLIPEWVTHVVVYGVIGVIALVAVVVLGTWTIEALSQAIKRRKD